MSELTEQVLRAAIARLPTIVASLLVVVIAWQLAKLTWSVLAPSPSTTIVTPSTGANPAPRAPRSDYTHVAGAHLFGETRRDGIVETAEPPVEAPETTLALTLTGILYTEDGSLSAAIISEHRGDEESYAIGAEIGGGLGAILRAVYSDRVILERDGRLETLRQPLELSNATPTVARRGGPPRGIDSGPARLGDVVRASRVQGNELTGIRVAPAGDAALFEALGFRTDDVITAVNGEFLEEATDLAGAMTALLDASYASLALVRDGAQIDFVVDIGSTRIADAE